MRALSVIGFTEHRFFIGFLRAQNCFPLIADTVRKDFWPLAEEHFFTLGREWGILIQKLISSDSIIAHFANHAISAATLQHYRPITESPISTAPPSPLGTMHQPDPAVMPARTQ